MGFSDFFNGFGNFFKKSVPNFFNGVGNIIKDVVSNGDKGLGSFLNGVGNKGKYIMGTIRKVPILGTIIDNSPFGPIVDKAIDITQKSRNIISNLGHGEWKLAAEDAGKLGSSI